MIIEQQPQATESFNIFTTSSTTTTVDHHLEDNEWERSPLNLQNLEDLIEDPESGCCYFPQFFHSPPLPKRHPWQEIAEPNNEDYFIQSLNGYET